MHPTGCSSAEDELFLFVFVCLFVVFFVFFFSLSVERFKLAFVFNERISYLQSIKFFTNVLF